MRDRILIVDDVELNREILRETLQEDYQILEVDSGKAALEFMEKERGQLSLVLLDLLMPGIDGLQVLKIMRERQWIDKLPVLVITGENSSRTEEKCLDYGVADFIKRPFNNTIVKKRVHNIVKLFQYQSELERKVEEQTEALREQNDLLQIQAKRLHRTNENLVDILGTVVEYRNLESGEHIKRVKGFTEILARQIMEEYPEYGLTERQIKTIVMASSFHDIGKIAIPDNILLKPGRLTKEEFEYMKSHTIRGGEIIDKLKGIWDEDCQKAGYEICRYHHERYDGNGYPDGLKEDEIPISAQIVSVADVYDALVSERVYKGPYSKEESYQMIIAGKCGIFAPWLLECLSHVKKQFEELVDRHQGGDSRNAGEQII
ncbi:MAG: response regulator [Roseburia sp.]|nr:response regulator [Roseburia sp.]